MIAIEVRPFAALKLAHLAIEDLRRTAKTCELLRTLGGKSQRDPNAVHVLLSDARDLAPVIRAALRCGCTPQMFRRRTQA